ncbi:hypothetical protein DYBT9275_02682 [Dyadobacter sp. CECT 9275]|uniref:Uncharacterized protein n=1 Tax=Dyadobacter helix TaxID=2822344 RepID=A0A916JBA4_9BACT|nr:hypothetical protein DYBT9275_02682 [Dyadobacter sp. CECT 9275]
MKPYFADSEVITLSIAGRNGLPLMAEKYLINSWIRKIRSLRSYPFWQASDMLILICWASSSTLPNTSSFCQGGLFRSAFSLSTASGSLSWLAARGRLLRPLPKLVLRAEKRFDFLPVEQRTDDQIIDNPNNRHCQRVIRPGEMW